MSDDRNKAKKPGGWSLDPNDPVEPPRDEAPAVKPSTPPETNAPKPAGPETTPKARIGLPDQEPSEDTFKPLSSPEDNILDSNPLTLEEAEAEILQLLTPPKRERWLKRLLKNRSATNIVILACGLLLLFLVATAASFFNSVSSLPLLGRVISWIGGGLLVLAVLFAMGRLLKDYLGFLTSPNVRLGDLQRLVEFSDLRAATNKKIGDYASLLQKWLKEYPLQSEQDKKELKRLGFTPKHIEQLVKQRNLLLDSSTMGSEESWLGRFEDFFLTILDEVAKERIRGYAWKVGINTGAAPTGFIDTTIVISNAFLMISDLCKIYHLRIGRYGTLLIMGRVFFNSFAASQMEHAADAASNAVVEAVFGEVPHALAKSLKGIAKGTLSRIAEGSTNAFLLLRLGSATTMLLRPIRKSKK